MERRMEKHAEDMVTGFLLGVYGDHAMSALVSTPSIPLPSQPL